MSSMSQYMNISDTDMKQVAASNIMKKQWFELLGLKKGTYIQFVADLARNPEMLVKNLDDEKKQKFYDELPEMLVPMAFEDRIISGCDRMIRKVGNKLGIKENVFDDAIAIGMMAIRNSVWHYTNTDICFTSYAYMAVKNRMMDFNRDLKAYEKHAIIWTVTDMNELHKEDISLENLAVYKVQAVPKFAIHNHHEGSDLSIRDVMYQAAIDESEHRLIDCFLSQGKQWASEYRRTVLNPRTNKCYTKQAVYKKLERLINRAKQIVSENEMQVS